MESSGGEGGRGLSVPIASGKTESLLFSLETFTLARLGLAQFASLVFTLAPLPSDCGRSQRGKTGLCYYRCVFISLHTVLPSGDDVRSVSYLLSSDD